MPARRRSRSREADLDFVRGILAGEKARRDPRLRQSLRVHLGLSLERMTRWSAAVREYRSALVESKREARRRKSPLGAEMLADVRTRLSRLASRRRHWECAMALLRASRRDLRSALRRWPAEESFVDRLGETGRFLAALVWKRQGHDAAYTALRSSLRDLEALSARDPASLAVQRQIAQSCVELAEICRWQHRPARGERHLDRAAAIYRTLLAIAPSDSIRMALALAVQEIGCLALQDFRERRARALFAQALEVMLGVEDMALQLDVEPLRIASCCHWVARACQIGGYDDAHGATRKAFAAYEAAARRGLKGRKWRDFGLEVAGHGEDLCRWLMRHAREVGRDWEVAEYRRRGHAMLDALGWRLPPEDRAYHARSLDEEAENA